MSLRLSLYRTPAGDFSKRLVALKSIQQIQIDLRNASAHKLERKLRFLNQSYVLHLIALWQAFVEDLVRYAYRQIELYDPHTSLHEIVEASAETALRRFNTPNREHIDRLFDEALAIRHISAAWASEGLTRDEALTTLDAILKARHQIAHRGSTPAAISMEYNFNCMETLYRMALAMENAVIKNLTERFANRRDGVDG